MKRRRLAPRRSKAFRDDPSLMKTRVKKFERKLVALIEDLKPDLLALVTIKEMEDPGFLASLADYRRQEIHLFELETTFGIKRELAPDLNALILRSRIAEILLKKFEEPAQELTGQTTLDAFNQGTTRADSFISATGSLHLPADKRVLALLQARSLADLKGMTETMDREIMRTITDGVLNGKGAKAIARDITGTVEISKNRARTIARTETMTAYNQAAVSRYSQRGIAKVKWSYTGEDGRACNRCRDLDYDNTGIEYDLDDHPDCPLHPNCRCVLLPVIPSLEEL